MTFPSIDLAKFLIKWNVHFVVINLKKMRKCELFCFNIFQKLIQEEEACRTCTIQEKQDFLQYIFDAFPNGSPLVERELVGSIRVSRKVVIFKFYQNYYLHLANIEYRTKSMSCFFRSYSL